MSTKFRDQSRGGEYFPIMLANYARYFPASVRVKHTSEDAIASLTRKVYKALCLFPYNDWL